MKITIMKASSFVYSQNSVQNLTINTRKKISHFQIASKKDTENCKKKSICRD